MRFARGLSADLEIKTPQALNAQLRRYEYPPGGIALRSLAFYGYTEVNEARRAEALLKGTKRRAPEKSRENGSCKFNPSGPCRLRLRTPSPGPESTSWRQCAKPRAMRSREHRNCSSRSRMKQPRSSSTPRSYGR